MGEEGGLISSKRFQNPAAFKSSGNSVYQDKETISCPSQREPPPAGRFSETD